MNSVAYESYLIPTEPNKEVVGDEDWYVFSGFNLTGSGGDEDEPAGVVSYSDGLIGRLRKRYLFRDAAVRGFLEEHRFLIQLLFTAHKKIRGYFPGSQLVLAVIADPEAQEQRELFVFIQTKLPPKAARPLLAAFRREWWLSAMLDAKGEMNIGLEYIRDEH